MGILEQDAEYKAELNNKVDVQLQELNERFDELGGFADLRDAYCQMVKSIQDLGRQNSEITSKIVETGLSIQTWGAKLFEQIEKVQAAVDNDSETPEALPKPETSAE
jgi:hypothetical protein